MKKIKAMIVDDIPLAIASLSADIADVLSDKIDIVATAQGVVEAAKEFRIHEPELIFLDIQMDDGDGFDLLDIIGATKAKVIFTTASREHALKAFKYAATDYLLKPVDVEDLVRAVERVFVQKPKEKSSVPRLTLKSQNAFELVELNHIIRLEADDNYTRVHLDDGSQRLVSKTMKSFEDKLDLRFIKTHQSHIINTEFVKKFIKTEGGYIILKNGDEIPVSIRKRAFVSERLS